jgi:hypothetical protein
MTPTVHLIPRADSPQVMADRIRHLEHRLALAEQRENQMRVVLITLCTRLAEETNAALTVAGRVGG